jgi:SAM-dependent methyltransferase
MNELHILLTNIFNQNLLVQATFSSPLKKNLNFPNKVTCRPIKTKDKLLYQISTYENNQVFHRNISTSECLAAILTEWIPNFKQSLLQTTEGDCQLLTNRKGETTILKRAASKLTLNVEHNRPKKYLLSNEKPLPFLIGLGLMDKEGKVYPQKMDKFRQINRFLEMVADILPNLDRSAKLRVIDFGCGKAYLTFALYHFLKEIKGFDICMTGVDLKEKVMQDCQILAKKLNYSGLKFIKSDIASFNPEDSIDMVVALHACDTATDIALAKAIKWKAKVILAAPCCQHELYKQVKSESLQGLLNYGILKERFASLVTDASRVQLLEMHGFKTQILEFIDSEHTPKNLLIRAIWGNTEIQQNQGKTLYEKLKFFLTINPSLEKMLS